MPLVELDIGPGSCSPEVGARRRANDGIEEESGAMRLIETAEEARQHIEANLRTLAKSALERSHESRKRHEAETDDRLKEIWKREAEAELRIAKIVNQECDTLLAFLRNKD